MSANNVPENTASWSRVGGFCGLLGIASYLAAAFAPLPETLGYAAAFAFGPLLAVGFFGLHHQLAVRRPGPLTQIAAAFGLAAGFTVLIMLTTQQAIFGVLAKLPPAEDAGAKTSRAQLEAGLDAVHYGVDVAWDVAVSVAVVLFALAMLRDPRFGRILGGLGVLCGLLLLGFNLAFFPQPPAAAGSLDWGPAVALWLLAAFVALLRSARPARTS